MANHIRFSLDIDGVVANFNEALTTLARDLNYRPRAQPTEQPGKYVLVSDTDRLDAWIDEHSEEFWGGLEPMATEADHTAIRRALAQGHELFWASARPSHRQHDLRNITLQWLQTHDFPVNEQHLLLGDKGQIVRAQGITAHLDDRVSHAIRVALSGVTCYMITRPWNIEEVRYGGYDFLLVDSIEEYITLVTAGE